MSNALREHRECMSGASFQSPWCLQACHESCQYQQNVKVQAININKARVLFMQTRYWERPLLLVSREALSWQLIICLVSIRCWGRERCQGRGIMNIIASFLILRFTHREINFPFKRINSDVAWAVSLPWGSRVFRFWRGGVSHCVNVTRCLLAPAYLRRYVLNILTMLSGIMATFLTGQIHIQISRQPPEDYDNCHSHCPR